MWSDLTKARDLSTSFSNKSKTALGTALRKLHQEYAHARAHMHTHTHAHVRTRTHAWMAHEWLVSLQNPGHPST